MSNELISVTNSWLSLAIPHLGPIADTIGFVQSLSDKLLFDKLYYVLSRQDSDFEEWLKISEKFEADNKDYNKMVQQLIYVVIGFNQPDTRCCNRFSLLDYSSSILTPKDGVRNVPEKDVELHPVY